MNSKIMQILLAISSLLILSCGPTLVDLVRKQDIPNVSKMLVKKCDLNQTNKYGYTPLMLARNDTIVELLLQHHANVNVKNKRTNSTALIECSKDIRSFNPDEWNIPGLSYEEQKIEVRNRNENLFRITKMLLDAGAKINDVDSDGRTALFHASDQDYPEYINLLLQNGADPNIIDKLNCNALWCAIKGGSTQNFNSLLKAGANLNTKPGGNYARWWYGEMLFRVREASVENISSPDGSGTSLRVGLYNHREDVEGNIFIKAVYKGLIREAKMILDNHIEMINDHNTIGFTALMIATLNQDVEMVKLLLENGAKVDVSIEKKFILQKIGYNYNTTRNCILELSTSNGYIQFNSLSAIEIAKALKNNEIANLLEQQNISSPDQQDVADIPLNSVIRPLTQEKEIIPDSVANSTTHVEVPVVTSAQGLPFAVGDIVIQYRHFTKDGYQSGERDKMINTQWYVIDITDDYVTLRLHAGQHKWGYNNEPFKKVGYQSNFESSDIYKQAFPGKKGNAQILEEFKRVK